MRGQMQRPQAALQLAGIVTLNNHSRKPLLAPVAGPAADQCNLTWHQRPKRDNAGGYSRLPSRPGSLYSSKPLPVVAVAPG
jgi:hypothetical protein